MGVANFAKKVPPMDLDQELCSGDNLVTKQHPGKVVCLMVKKRWTTNAISRYNSGL